MKRKTTLLLGTVLALVICVVLVALRAAGAAVPSAAESVSEALPHAAEAPAEAQPELPEATPHQHSFDPETGMCTLCGFACEHSAGFDESHRCLDCGWQCRNQIHDPETALCPVCGEAFCHHFGMDGICDVCGAKAPLYDAELPDRFFEPSEHEGRHFREILTDADGLLRDIAVWLPWDYSEDVRYNVVVLMHGDGGQAADWTDEPENTYRGEIEFRHVYDRIVEERLCEPFLIVGISNVTFRYPPGGEAFLREKVLPYIAENFSTYLGDGSPEALAAGREHLAVGGLSRGSMYTYSCVMPRCLDIVGNFCCFSNGDNSRVYTALNSKEFRDYPILSYIASYGMMDEQQVGIAHRNVYRSICNNVERVTDGDNARMLAIGAGHNFIMWTTSLYDALLLMF
ncbi:MAG: hypothetical protein IJP64_00785 [Oscillospiraceae bacterium]|nr:hypothetical protein [Oscillospiraceae bacterium]